MKTEIYVGPPWCKVDNMDDAITKSHLGNTILFVHLFPGWAFDPIDGKEKWVGFPEFNQCT